MTRKYLGESHKEYSEACQKAVERMSKHPYTHEQCLEQAERLRKASELGDASDILQQCCTASC